MASTGAELEETVGSVVKQLIPGLDELFAPFVTSMIADGIEDGSVESGDSLHGLIGATLLDYEAAKSTGLAKALCQKIFGGLNSAGVFEGRVSRSQSVRSQITVGMEVDAKYWEDESWYAATVDDIDGDEFWVTFTAYGNQEKVDVAGIRPNKKALRAAAAALGFQAPKKMQDVTSQQSCSVTAKIEALQMKKEYNAILTGSLTAGSFGLTSKQKRALAKKKAKEDALAKWDPMKFHNALKPVLLKEWLEPGLHAKPKDVHIPGYTMHTVDGSRELIIDSNLKFVHGMKYGLVGKNGCGKTTLLRRISRFDIAEFPKHIRVLHVEQEIVGDDTSVLQYVLSADVVRMHCVNEQARIQKLVADGDKSEDLTAQMTRIHTLMDEMDFYSMESRASQILSGLGFAKDMQEQPTKRLSGGWRMRVALACALFVAPDFLLLDEPTNHLDFPSVLWLENYLQNYPKTCIIVSHDRRFLNNTVTHIMALEKQKVTYYKGDFAQYQKTKLELMKNQKKAYVAQQMHITHVQEFIDKWRYNAKKASIVQSKIKLLQRLELLEDVSLESEFKFVLPDATPIKDAVFRCDHLHFYYKPEKILLNDVNLQLDTGSRIGVLGANGVGKSTLIKCLMNEIEPVRGTVSRNRTARVAVFAQHHVDQLDLNKCPLDFFLEMFADDLQAEKNSALTVRRRLGRFNIGEDLALKQIRKLSGGEKSRVTFAMICWKAPNFIILDEPTNHLDMETIDALIAAINSWQGGLLIVSHDQHFLTQVGKTFWAVADGEIKQFHSFEQTKQFALTQKATT